MGNNRGKKTAQGPSSSSTPAGDKSTPPPLKLDTSPLSSESENSKTTRTSSNTSATSTTSSKSNLDSTTSTQTNLTSPMSSPEMQSLGKTIGNLRQVIEAVKGTCEFLEKSTDYVAKAGPAIKDAEELERVRNLLHSRKAEHEAELLQLQTKLVSDLQTEIKNSLRDKAIKEVKERVRKELANSVTRELHLQTPIDLLDQTSQHESQILQVRATVHNSEARARNSAVHAGSDPLQQLWLPNGTAHALFPATVRDLANLSSRDVETLLGAYGVILPHSKTDTQAESAKQVKQGEASSLTAKINCFMTFIGVPLRAVPAPSSASSSKEGKRLTSMLLILSSF